MPIPLLSVVIPCYNHGIYLDECLGSIYTQNRQENIEVILVNDGSTDPYTIEKLNSLKHPLLKVVHQENKGLSAARNTGIEKAKGELILNLDSDNKLVASFISDAIAIFTQNPRIDVLYPDKFTFHDGKKGQELIKIEFFHIRKLLLCNFIDSCAVFRKSIWEKVNGFDVNISIYQDWEFWIACHRAGAIFFHHKKPGFFYRISSGSMVHSATEQNKNREVHYILAKHSDLYAEHINAIGYALRYTLKKPLQHLFRVLVGKPFLLSPRS